MFNFNNARWQSHLPRYYSDVPRIVARGTHVKVIYTSQEYQWVEYLKSVLPKNRRGHPYPGTSSTSSTEPRDPWRQLRIGTAMREAVWSHEWVHAGRRYTFTLTKYSPDPSHWRWAVSTSRAYFNKPFASGEGLASLCEWVRSRWPGTVTPEPRPTDAPEAIRWPKPRA